MPHIVLFSFLEAEFQQPSQPAPIPCLLLIYQQYHAACQIIVLLNQASDHIYPAPPSILTPNTPAIALSSPTACVVRRDSVMAFHMLLRCCGHQQRRDAIHIHHPRPRRSQLWRNSTLRWRNRCACTRPACSQTNRHSASSRSSPNGVGRLSCFGWGQLRLQGQGLCGWLPREQHPLAVAGLVDPAVAGEVHHCTRRQVCHGCQAATAHARVMLGLPRPVDPLLAWSAVQMARWQRGVWRRALHSGEVASHY